jgi:polysaccharide biosynthesis/export protein
MKKEFKYIFPPVFLILIILAVSGCVPVQKLKYFNDIDNLMEPIVNPREQKVIMPNDYIYIRVFSIDENTNLLFNSNASLPNSASANIIGYLVDISGNINYPFTGKVNVAGLTTEHAGEKLGLALSEYVSNAAVSVKFIDNKVSVMGEVQIQGVYSFSQDKLNIYEALALGGGISRFGDRKNVILIRQDGDKILHHKLDLSDSRIASKEYYYIQANDVIVVEPLKSSSWYNFNNSTFTTFLSSITTILTVYTFFLLK